MGVSLFTGYYDTAIRPSVSYQNPFTEIRINENKKVVLERWPVCREIELRQDDIPRFGRRYLDSNGKDEATRDEQRPPWDEMDRFERIPEGLATYY